MDKRRIIPFFCFIKYVILFVGDIMGLIKTKNRGSLIVISGPSGVDKATIIKEYIKGHDNVWLSVSMTSRPIRENYIEGETYYFV